MNDDKIKIINESKGDIQKPDFLIEDIVRYLSRLSNLNKDSEYGNIELSKGLKKLASALRPHSQMPILKIGDVINKSITSDQTKELPKKPKVELPPYLDSLSDEKIDEIINESDFTKDQLIELGYRRFGIPKAKLMRSNKDSVIESVRAAFDHEKSLGVISQEARRGGEERSS